MTPPDQSIELDGTTYRVAWIRCPGSRYDGDAFVHDGGANLGRIVLSLDGRYSAHRWDQDAESGFDGGADCATLEEAVRYLTT